MALKHVIAASLGATLLVWGGVSMAEEYKPDEFLGMDLSKAVLSPNPLGPASEFAPVPVEARADHPGEGAQASVQPNAGPKIAVLKTRVETRVAHMRAEKPRRGVARAKLARRHGNPLDAQAFDTRIQVWPCKSGGICNWRQPGR